VEISVIAGTGPLVILQQRAMHKKGIVWHYRQFGNM